MSNDGNPPQVPPGPPPADDDSQTRIRPAGSPTAPQSGNPGDQQPPSYGQPQQPPPYAQPQQPQYGQPQQPPPYGQQQQPYPPAGQYGAPQYAAQPGYQGYGQTPAAPAGGYASWGNRAVATLWDLFYMWPALVGYFVGVVLIIIGAGMAANDSGGGLIIALGSLVLLAAFAYGIWLYIRNYMLDQGRSGYTYGKRKVGIRTISESTGQPAGVGSCVLRWLLHGVINQVIYIDYLWPLWDDKNQTLTDKLLGTIVIKQPAAS